jgi:hypothetical protein
VHDSADLQNGRVSDFETLAQRLERAGAAVMPEVRFECVEGNRIRRFVRFTEDERRLWIDESLGSARPMTYGRHPDAVSSASVFRDTHSFALVSSRSASWASSFQCSDRDAPDDPLQAADAVDAEVRHLDKDVAASSTRTMVQILDGSIGSRRFNTVVGTARAAVASHFLSAVLFATSGVEPGLITGAATLSRSPR